MHQSLPYLRDPQSTVRLAAVRFISESQPLPGPFWASLATSLPLHWQQGATLWQPQPPCAEPQPPSAPCHKPGLVTALLSPTPFGCWWPLGQPCGVGGRQGRGSPCWEHSGSRE